MKKIIAVAGGFAVLCAAVCAAPAVAVSAVPTASGVYPKVVMYSRTLSSVGTLSYMGQSEVTSPLPLVIDSYTVKEGDEVTAGQVIAKVDRKGTESYIDSMGQLSQLAVAASNLSAAMALIPEEITADCSGKIIATAGRGKAVQSGDSIATITPTESLVISAPISEQYISQVSVGSAVTFALTAYPEEQFSGTVTSIAAAARSRYSGSVLETVVDISIVPDSVDERFKSGLTADVTVTLTDPRKICVLPYEAIGQDEGGEYVYLYRNGKAQRQRIFTGVEFSDGTEIVKGVEQNDMVLKNPESLAGKQYIRVSED